MASWPEVTVDHRVQCLKIPVGRGLRRDRFVEATGVLPLEPLRLFPRHGGKNEGGRAASQPDCVGAMIGRPKMAGAASRKVSAREEGRMSASDKAGGNNRDPDPTPAAPGELADRTLCRILSLDGGGAKGFYTLGALKEIEGLIGGKLCDRFDLVFGTSTGAIIAALVGLGYPVDEMPALYSQHVVKIMGRLLPSQKSAALAELSAEVFGDKKFDAFQTNMGIVCTRWDFERPLIFKTSPDQAFAGRGTFVPGFGCTIGDAVTGSCSAYPFFKRKAVTTSTGERVDVADGGYCANNPTLYALSDATESLGVPRTNVRVVSIGVGEYPTPRKSWLSFLRWFGYLPSVQLLQK